jgi:cytochrome b subunit of formate dehydrogenase
MRNPTVYRYARMIHRYLVVIVLLLGMYMMVTGICMYSGQYLGLDPVTVRYMHHNVSVVFSIVLGGMMITGSYLFIFPYLRP